MIKIFSSKTRRRINAAHSAFLVATKRIFEVVLKLLRRIFSNKRRIKRALKAILKGISRSFRRASKFIMRNLSAWIERY